MKSPLTTLCYIEHGGCYLMMHRVCKENDENQDKWIGIGGHFEEGESPEECLIREAKEETGLTLQSFRFRGLVTFVSDLWGTEYMCLYTAKLPKDADTAGKIPKLKPMKKKGQEMCGISEMESPRTDFPETRRCEEGDPERDESVEKDLETGVRGMQEEGIVMEEGILEWVPVSEIENLNLWEGDKIFLRLLSGDAPFFSLKLKYEGDVLKEAVLDGQDTLKKQN